VDERVGSTFNKETSSKYTDILLFLGVVVVQRQAKIMKNQRLTEKSKNSRIFM